jgi:hypothetical protein
VSVIVCGQAEILGGRCLECEGPVPTVGGVLSKLGWLCSEDCASDMTERIARLRAETHLHQRDLMCECDTCIAAGHPTDMERTEWAEYLVVQDGTQ